MFASKQPAFIPRSAVPDSEVSRSVRRFGDFSADGLQPLMAPAGTDHAGALLGPDGSSICARQLQRGSHTEIAASSYLALIVVRGAVELRTGNGPRVRLHVHDCYVFTRGSNLEVTALDSETVLLEIYHDSDQNRPGGLARWRHVTPVRDRFPVRFAPRLNAILSPHNLYPLVGPIGHGPGRFETVGPDGLVIALANTPRFTGPALHVHTISTEVFVVTHGCFRIYWGENGEYEALLGPLDVIVIPRGINRAFEAYGEGDNWMLPIVFGATDELEDIAWLPEVGRQLAAAGPKLLTALMTKTRLRIAERAP